MTNKEAIAELEELVIKQARIGFFDEEVEAMQHAIDVLKRFDGAVELTNGVGYIQKHGDEFLQSFTSNYNLYAIPKEQENGEITNE